MYLQDKLSFYIPELELGIFIVSPGWKFQLQPGIIYLPCLGGGQGNSVQAGCLASQLVNHARLDSYSASILS